ncbi:MAG: hypothetical protein C0411_21120 [Pseudomonas sp.]|nr:hypothetical protein [Pseudomonas sp.]
MIAVLALSLLSQGAGAFNDWRYKSKFEAEAERLRGVLAALEQRYDQASAPADIDRMAGAVFERNRWMEDRCRSPAGILSMLDQAKPAGIRLLTFEGKLNGGTLRLLAADMDSASKYLRQVFHSGTDRLTLESRSPEGLILVYTWTG